MARGRFFSEFSVGKGVVNFTSNIVKQDDTVAVTGSWTVLFRDQ